MFSCPCCHQPVPTPAIACPHCRTLLKAHGHPGIPLHRALGEAPLCQSCLYHFDDSCTFPQRPEARACTLYRNHNEALTRTDSSLSTSQVYKSQTRHRYGWLWL
ncbi:MAG TPA: hypothetical protein V6D03_11105, partial [Candidatus Caenarcaniphilales bacterium]